MLRRGRSEYDNVLVAAAGMPDRGELVDRLLLGGPRFKRLVTPPVFDAVKRGLELSRYNADRQQLEWAEPPSPDNADPGRAPAAAGLDAGVPTRPLQTLGSDDA